MRARTHTAAHQQHSGDDALAKLLSAESRLAARLADARADAEETVRLAREEAKRIEDACAATIEAQTAALAAEHESQVSTELADIVRQSQIAAARFDAVDAQRLREFVPFVIEWMLPAETAERVP